MFMVRVQCFIRVYDFGFYRITFLRVTVWVYISLQFGFFKQQTREKGCQESNMTLNSKFEFFKEKEGKSNMGERNREELGSNCYLQFLGLVQYYCLNNNFHYLNNNTRIFTTFFSSTHIYTTFNQRYQKSFTKQAFKKLRQNPFLLYLCFSFFSQLPMIPFFSHLPMKDMKLVDIAWDMVFEQLHFVLNSSKLEFQDCHFITQISNDLLNIEILCMH